jgi:hypothetical protein
MIEGELQMLEPLSQPAEAYDSPEHHTTLEPSNGPRDVSQLTQSPAVDVRICYDGDANQTAKTSKWREKSNDATRNSFSQDEEQFLIDIVKELKFIPKQKTTKSAKKQIRQPE